MNASEKAKLERIRFESRLIMKQTKPTIDKLRKLLKRYQETYASASVKFHDADLSLAEIDGRLKKLKKPEEMEADPLQVLLKRAKAGKLSTEQLNELKRALCPENEPLE